jgi:hypothetical protein
MRVTRRTVRAWLSGALAILLAGAAAAPSRGATVGGVVDEAAKGAAAGAAAQKQVDALSDDADSLAAEYRAALQKTRALKVYNAQLEHLLASQREEIATCTKQIDDATVVGRGLLPMMARMVDGLDEFVALDLPFLPDERQSRVAGLRAMMDRADVTIAEKYRRILEAFQIENEYGRTIEAYRGKLQQDGKTRTVDFLRIGRTVLLYQTLDGQESGAWDPQAHAWTTISGYDVAIRQGIRMARKQVAPDLLRLPVPAPGWIR